MHTFGYDRYHLTVPASLTRGNAKHCNPPAQGVETNFPATHCENAPFTQPVSLSAHGVSAVMDAN